MRVDGVVTSDVKPPVSRRVRRVFGLSERVAPAVGARWAIELWCTPPAVEMSLRMPPGVSAGELVEAPWSGHRIAGESWGAGACRVPGARLGRLPRAPGGLRQTARRGRTPGHRVRSAEPQRVGPRRTRAGTHHDRRVRRSGAGDRAGARSGAGHRGAFPRRQGRRACGVVGHAGRTAGVPCPDGRLLVVSGPVRRSAWLGSRIRDRLHRRLDRRLGIPLYDTDISHVAAHAGDPPPLLVVHDPDDPDSPTR